MRIYIITIQSQYIGDETYLSKSALGIINKIMTDAEYFDRKVTNLPIRRGLENMKNGDTKHCEVISNSGNQLNYIITVMDYPEF